MRYYEIWVRSARYHAQEPLTYAHDGQLPIGQLVVVPMAQQTVTGMVTAAVAKPKFAAKPIQTVLDLPPMPTTAPELARWLISYYPAPLGLVAQQFFPEILKVDSLPPPTKLPAPNLAALPPLTVDQKHALGIIKQPDTYLLHGVTGSGKTRVYLELAARTVVGGQSAIILTPEISLTSQLVERSRAVFGNDRVVLLHSRLTPAERRRTWQQILAANQPLVIIGPRSALFSPLGNIGLIVMDEAHEPAYKQEQIPHYQSVRVAAKLRELHNATLVLGSATPAINDYYLAQNRHKHIITMDNLAVSHGSTIESKPQVELIDIKNRELFSRSQHLSSPLIKAIETALSKGEQALIYLNRRGTARLVICEACGWQAMCSHCDLPMTYHGDQHELRCHICNRSMSPPTICPACHKPSIIYKTIGTKALVTEVEKLFPEAKVQRFDTDNERALRFEQQYQNILDGNVDILVGTQILAKGLDLPRLSVLGVVLADTSLQLPDYTAGERTYQLLSQVLGRISRGHRSGQAFVQTYQPNNKVVQNALQSNWGQFYQNELAERKQFKFPPYYYLLKLTVHRASAAAAAKAAQAFAKQLAPPDFEVITEGPAPSLHEKVGGKYHQQLVVKAGRRSELIKVVRALPTGWSYDLDPADLL